MLICVAVLGCGEPRNRVAVGGNVTVDGKALPKGSIIFKPASKEAGPQTAATIDNGTYRLDAKQGPGVGKYNVLIYADQPPDFNMDDPDEFFDRENLELPKNAIPAEYNTRTTLEVVTTQGDSNNFDFDIKTPKEP